MLVTGGLLLAVGSVGGAGGDAAPSTPPEAAPVQRSVAPASALRAAPDPRGVRPEVVVVPALGVRAEVLPIETEDGALTPPADPQQLGWWSGGARVGAASGAAVLTGHTVHTGGGALDDLEDLAPGDRVVVGSAREIVRYAVDSVRVLSRAELARQSAGVFARSGPGRLVLITCEDWDGTAYRSNVVVVARPASR